MGRNFELILMKDNNEQYSTIDINCHGLNSMYDNGLIAYYRRAYDLMGTDETSLLEIVVLPEGYNEIPRMREKYPDYYDAKKAISELFEYLNSNQIIEDLDELRFQGLRREPYYDPSLCVFVPGDDPHPIADDLYSRLRRAKQSEGVFDLTLYIHNDVHTTAPFPYIKGMGYNDMEKFLQILQENQTRLDKTIKEVQKGISTFKENADSQNNEGQL